MTAPIIETWDVCYRYPDGTTALRNMTFSVNTGRRVAVLGPNGAGKSTLFLLLNGILRPSSGHILFKGSAVEYSRQSLLELRKNVGIVFQDPDNQLFSASVLQDVAFGPLNLGLSRDEALARAKTAMRETGITGLENRPTHFLSYGQKKRVSIAGVLAMDPAVIIFDEPTACLDPLMAKKVMQMLDELSCRGKSIVMSTHDVDLAYEWADYVYLLKDGAVAGEGKPREIFLLRELLHRCELTCPWVVETYLELTGSGCLPPSTPLPRGREELFQTIRGAAVPNIMTRTALHG